MQTFSNVEFGTRAFPAVKFGSHHFPVGTVFKLNDDPGLGENRAKPFQVKSVIQAVDFNCLLETTQPKPKDVFGDMMETFHVCHVAEIIYRGTGPVVIETTLNSDQTMEVVEMIENSLSHTKDICSAEGLTVGKNSIAFTFDHLPRVLWLYSATQPGMYLDEGQVYALFKKSSFFPKLTNTFFGDIYIVKKKALKKWFKQNHNRFLSSVKKYQKEYDEMMSAMYDRELEIDDIVEDLGDLDQNQSRIDALIEQVCPDELLEGLDSEVQLGTMVDDIRDEAYRQFKESGLAEQNLTTDESTPVKVKEGDVAMDWPYGVPRFSMGEISEKHLEKKHEEDE